MEINVPSFTQRACSAAKCNITNRSFSWTSVSYALCVVAKAALSSIFFISAVAVAQTPTPKPWPTKPVRIVVPFAAGSFTDTAARTLGKELTTALGQPVIVENRTGAGGTLGNGLVAKAEPDGHTLLLTDNSFAVAAALYKKLPYDPHRDLVPLAQVAEAPAVLVARTSLPAKDLRTIVSLARQDPIAMTFGSGGQGSSGHLAFEELLLQTGARMTHVPYKGVAAAVMDVIGQRIDLAIGSVGSTRQHISDGRVIGIALSGESRNPALPRVPTFAEAGYPNYTVMYWFGVLGPARMPPELRQTIQASIMKATNSAELKKVFEGAGVSPAYTDSTEFGKHVRDEITRWSRVVEKAQITPQ